MPHDYLHRHPEFADLIRIVAANERIDPALVEKDYWIMHCLYGLQQLGLRFELKGGTSLSKGYGIIDRFSEDIDRAVLLRSPKHAVWRISFLLPRAKHPCQRPNACRSPSCAVN